MKCAGAPDCPKPARYVVGNDGYCGTHQGEAFRRMKAHTHAMDAAVTERVWIHRQVWKKDGRLGRNIDAKERERARRE